MQCPLCGNEKAHKHGKIGRGWRRYLCQNCQRTFTDTFDTIYYRRHIPLLFTVQPGENGK